MRDILSKRSKFAENPIAKLHKAAERLSENGTKILRLDTGDPTVYFDTPKYIIDAYVRALRENRTNYARAEGVKELVDAVINRYKRMYGLSFSEKDVVITAGLSEAFFFMNSALIDRGDSAILLKPYYPPYYTYLKLNDGRELMGRYDEEDNWDIDIDSIKKVLKKKAAGSHVKYMMVTNPNNPTGTVMSRNTLKEIVDIANDNDIFLISDEIYDEIVFGGVSYTSIGKLAKGIPHMIWNGASKNFDATGFRVGFVIIPEEDEASNSIKSAFSDYAVSRLSINTPAQYAVAEALNNTKKHTAAVRKMTDEIESRVKYAAGLINESKYLKVVEPSGAFYLFPKIDLKALKFKDDNDFVLSVLQKTGVQIRSGSAFGAPGHFRMVSLAPKEILGYAIDRINELCENNARR